MAGYVRGARCNVTDDANAPSDWEQSQAESGEADEMAAWERYVDSIGSPADDWETMYGVHAEATFDPDRMGE